MTRPGRAVALLVVLLYCFADHAAAECVVEQAVAGSQRLFKTHLSAGCTPVEREARAVDASAVVAALKRGQTIDLAGVVIRGDVALDALPVTESPPVIDDIIDRDDKEIRVIGGPVAIVDSVVRGTVTHRTAVGTLVFSGPVTPRPRASPGMSPQRALLLGRLLRRPRWRRPCPPGRFIDREGPGGVSFFPKSSRRAVLGPRPGRIVVDRVGTSGGRPSVGAFTRSGKGSRALAGHRFPTR